MRAHWRVMENIHVKNKCLNHHHVICAEDVCCWAYSVGMLVKWVAFLGTLHWPAAGTDLGEGEVSHVEMLAHFVRTFWLGRGWCWKTQYPVMDGLDVQFQCRLFLVVEALIFGARVGLSGAS